MTEVALTLRNLVRVVREGVVHAAAVQVEVFAVVLHRNAGALDVPARISDAPGGIPLERLILELGLREPEDEVVLVLLVLILLHALAHADGEVFLVVVVEDIVARELARVEVHIAAGDIGIAGVEQLRDDLDIIVDQARCGLDDVGALDVELLAVGEERVGVELGDLHDGLVLAAGALEHLVLALIGIRGQMADVGDVHDALDRIPGVTQILFQHILHDIAAEVADMGKMIDRGAAGVHFDQLRVVGDEFFFFMGRRVVQVHINSPFGRR